jgi:hypothetical protein
LTGSGSSYGIGSRISSPATVVSGSGALGLDLLEIQKLTRTTNHRNRVTAAHRDGH